MQDEPNMFYRMYQGMGGDNFLDFTNRLIEHIGVEKSLNTVIIMDKGPGHFREDIKFKYE